MRYGRSCGVVVAVVKQTDVAMAFADWGLPVLPILTRDHAQALREQLDRWMAHAWDATPKTFERISGKFRALRAFRRKVMLVG